MFVVSEKIIKYVIFNVTKILLLLTGVPESVTRPPDKAQEYKHQYQVRKKKLTNKLLSSSASRPVPSEKPCVLSCPKNLKLKNLKTRKTWKPENLKT